MVEGRDCERCKGRVHQVSNATCGTTMMFRPASTEALKDAEDAAVTRFSTTRPVASELSRKILTCAFVLVVACIRLAVQFHEGLERNGSSCTARQKPHEQSQPANQQQTCCKGNRIGRGNRSSVMTCVPKVEVYEPVSECALHQRVIGTLLGKCSTTDL